MPDRRPALTMLADSPEGCTEAILLVHGFRPKLIAELVAAGLAMAATVKDRRDPHPDHPCRATCGGPLMPLLAKRKEILEHGRFILKHIRHWRGSWRGAPKKVAARECLACVGHELMHNGSTWGGAGRLGSSKDGTHAASGNGETRRDGRSVSPVRIE
jgi:hypothetical protein